MTGPQAPTYRAESAEQLLVEPLDTLTVIYQRRSGVTHIVAEPVPEILAAMGNEALTADQVAERLSALFEIESFGVGEIIAARLEELAELGLVERARA